MLKFRTLFAALLIPGACIAAGSLHAQDTPHPGEILYQTNCAGCHSGADPRAPSLATLRSMNEEALNFTLTSGVMAVQGQNLTPQQREAVVNYLAAAEINEAWINDSLCEPEHRQVRMEPVSLAGAGGDLRFSRNLSAEQSGLSSSELADLELAWAFGFPGITGLRSAPVVAGDSLFYPAGSTGKVLALDSETGCVKWAYDAGAGLRASASLSEPLDDGKRVLVVTDEQVRVHAIDPETGKAQWIVSAQVDPEAVTRLTGAPLHYQGRIFVPVSASGVATAADPLHECCDGRGAVVALDARTGETLWHYYTMPLADYTGEVNSAGARLRGPSGAPIWSSPSLDEERRLLYITTGENTSLPATETSNAIIALDIDTGEQQWLFQAIANDVWNMACTGRTPGPNCPSAQDSILKDWDFGGAAVLVDLPEGGQLLLAGQKSGHLWALNPDDGALVWQQRVGQGGTLGGNHWGLAASPSMTFMPVNDPHYASLTDDQIHAGVYAFDTATGRAVWQFRGRPDCANGREMLVETCQEKYGFSAMPLLIDGALVAANIDGRIFIFDGVDGRVLMEYDSSRYFETLNGVEARGGSIDAHSVAAGSGMLFVGSGYERFRQQAGNVLLAFRPARKSAD